MEEYCRGREGVTFVHVAPWPGYKAGVCNLALRQHTDPRAEIIGMVDADDIVKPYYLRETASYFCDPQIGFVQTCEGNRDYEGSAYYTACVDSYQGFYLAVMSSRNERDTVPFVGTMGLFRRSALEGAGGWNEWCISEDTEASLRVLKAGWSGLYIPRCFGRGALCSTPRYSGVTPRYSAMRRSIAGSSCRLRSSISCVRSTPRRPSSLRREPLYTPREPLAFKGQSSSSIHSSARIGSWNHRLWSMLGPPAGRSGTSTCPKPDPRSDTYATAQACTSGSSGSGVDAAHPQRIGVANLTVPDACRRDFPDLDEER